MNASHFSFKNRTLIEKSSKCGCTYCLSVFLPETIQEWLDDGQTAICPECRVDAVVCSEQTSIEKSDLAKMHEESFGKAVDF